MKSFSFNSNLKSFSLQARVAVILLVLALSSCSASEDGIVIPSNADPFTAVSWTPDQASYVTRPGEPLYIGGTISYADGTTATCNALCQSSDEVAVWDAPGICVVGLEQGSSATVSAEVRLYATNDADRLAASFGAEVSVSVLTENSPLASMSLGESEVTLTEGESHDFTVTVSYPDGDTKRVHSGVCEWSFEDDGTQHITINPMGMITAKQTGSGQSGKTKVTASYTENGVTVSASADVIVKRKEMN